MTAQLVFGAVATLCAGVSAWLAADRWSKREELEDLRLTVTRLSMDLIQLDEVNHELASVVAVIHELISIHEEADLSVHEESLKWLGTQVQVQLRELLEFGWSFEADLDEGGFRAERRL
jgi:hypothetical protein